MIKTSVGIDISVKKEGHSTLLGFSKAVAIIELSREETSLLIEELKKSGVVQCKT